MATVYDIIMHEYYHLCKINKKPPTQLEVYKTVYEELQQLGRINNDNKIETMRVTVKVINNGVTWKMT